MMKKHQSLLKRYSAYKDSGIEWIGEVPEHWMIGKIRRVLNILTDFTANGSFADLKRQKNLVNTKS